MLVLVKHNQALGKEGGGSSHNEKNENDSSDSKGEDGGGEVFSFW
jgi:hypothetical protein